MKRHQRRRQPLDQIGLVSKPAHQLSWEASKQAIGVIYWWRNLKRGMKFPRRHHHTFWERTREKGKKESQVVTDWRSPGISGNFRETSESNWQPDWKADTTFMSILKYGTRPVFLSFFLSPSLPLLSFLLSFNTSHIQQHQSKVYRKHRQRFTIFKRLDWNTQISLVLPLSPHHHHHPKTWMGLRRKN